MWVRARQYTGRLVTVSNPKIFDEPVYNYTLEFPYLWEEMRIPVSYKDDRRTKGEKLSSSFDFLFKGLWRGSSSASSATATRS